MRSMCRLVRHLEIDGEVGLRTWGGGGGGEGTAQAKRQCLGGPGRGVGGWGEVPKQIDNVCVGRAGRGVGSEEWTGGYLLTRSRAAGEGSLGGLQNRKPVRLAEWP